MNKNGYTDEVKYRMSVLKRGYCLRKQRKKEDEAFKKANPNWVEKDEHLEVPIDRYVFKKMFYANLPT